MQSNTYIVYRFDSPLKSKHWQQWQTWKTWQTWLAFVIPLGLSLKVSQITWITGITAKASQRQCTDQSRPEPRIATDWRWCQKFPRHTRALSPSPVMGKRGHYTGGTEWADCTERTECAEWAECRLSSANSTVECSAIMYWLTKWNIMRTHRQWIQWIPRHFYLNNTNDWIIKSDILLCLHMYSMKWVIQPIFELKHCVHIKRHCRRSLTSLTCRSL